MGNKKLIKEIMYPTNDYVFQRIFGYIGEDYKRLKRTIIILIANFEVDFLKEDRDYHTECGIFANVDKS